MSAIDVETVGRTMTALLERAGREIVYRDPASGTDIAVTPTSAGSPSGLLPAFLIAGEAVWRETTGQGFALDIVRDPAALLGYRLRGIDSGSFTTVLLSTMEATAQIAGPQAIAVNDLQTLWAAATDRIERSVEMERGMRPDRGTEPERADTVVPSRSGPAP